MNGTVEKWALVAMMISGCVLLLGDALDGEWLKALLWAVVVTWTAVLLQRRHSRATS